MDSEQNIDPFAVVAEHLNQQAWVTSTAHPQLVEASRHVNHKYNSDCAICARDLTRIAAAALAAAEGVAEYRAAQAWSRSGFMLDPDVLEEVIGETAAKMQGLMDDFTTALRLSEDHKLRFPNAAVSDGLAALAALSAALDYAPVMTAREAHAVTAGKRTFDDHELRLHLAAEHAAPWALGASDQDAAKVHEKIHAVDDEQQWDGYRPHPIEHRDWTEAKIRQVIADNAGQWEPTQFSVALAEHIAHVDAPDGFTPAADRLRLHNLSAHSNLAALGHTDAEAAEYHHDEHHGPGGIRNHDEHDFFWDPQKINEVVASGDDGMFLYEQEVETLKRRLREHLARVAETPAVGDGITVTVPAGGIRDGQHRLADFSDGPGLVRDEFDPDEVVTDRDGNSTTIGAIADLAFGTPQPRSHDEQMQMVAAALQEIEKLGDDEDTPQQ